MRLSEVKKCLLKLHGVLRFEFNRDTGSVTLHFTSNSVHPEQVLKVLRSCQCIPQAAEHHHGEGREMLKEGAMELTTHFVEEVLHEL